MLKTAWSPITPGHPSRLATRQAWSPVTPAALLLLSAALLLLSCSPPTLLARRLIQLPLCFSSDISISTSIEYSYFRGSWFENFGFKPRAVAVVYRAKREERESEGEWAPEEKLFFFEIEFLSYSPVFQNHLNEAFAIWSKCGFLVKKRLRF